MIELVALLESAYFTLLVASYILLSNPRLPSGVGLTLSLLSLAPPTLAAALLLPSFIAASYEFFAGNILAYVALAAVTFALLLALFIELGVCSDELEGASKTACIYMAFAAAALGSLILFYLAASGGLAIAFCAMHYVSTAAVYGAALRTRGRVEWRRVELLHLARSLKRSCIAGDPSSALALLGRLLESGFLAEAVSEEVAREGSALLGELEHYYGTGKVHSTLRKVQDWATRLEKALA